ncbi:AraC family transcriptional regulator [Flavobacterium collinsii]|uniref:HTH araC/xylS-type domain-containing protein n=1 Tax=Flavobacterium collinsii TaxID=1114861 RepID=A0A9W4TG27_9FLAO|nr:helix-turn-helix domain-containing protein [Flavobacterium collinsii]CAI2766268.1 HTH araC/xylS-type domain-containing protein [Flavobacterium collinsii]
MQISPSEELSPYIKHYLFLDHNEMAVQKLRLFSDGNTGIVFSLKGKLSSDFNDSKIKNHLPDSFLYGQLSGFKDIYSNSAITLVIVVFQPNGIHQLLGIPAHEFLDSIVSIDDIFDKNGLILQEKLSDDYTIAKKVELLNHFFSTHISNKKVSDQLIVESSIRFINAHKGSFNVKQLAKYTGYTERHLERKFQESIGLNPKKFGNIIKLHHFLKLLKDKTADTNLTSICYNAGFSDQSHLIKEFRKHTGITPKEYLHNTGKLTNNLLRTAPPIVL